MEQVIRFLCGGVPVHGTLHTPRESFGQQGKIGVVFLASGVRSRRGPCRLYVRFARRLCEAGYAVLRYDPPGIGDSPGAMETLPGYKRQFLDCTEHVASVLDYFRDAAGVERVGLVGLCGGAYSAMVAAARPEIEFLVLASLPIQDVGDLSADSVLDVAIEGYLCKLLDWRAWYKFFSGRSHYDWAIRAALRVLAGKYHCPEPNAMLWDALRRSIADGRKMLLVYGTQDPLYAPFAKHYHKELLRLEGFQTGCRVHVVQDANHTFTQMRWQEELIDTTLGWLEETLAVALVPGVPGTSAGAKR